VNRKSRKTSPAEKAARAVTVPDLTSHFGRGFSYQNLYRLRQFYVTYAPEILSTASRKSSDEKGPTLWARLCFVATVCPFCHPERQRRISPRMCTWTRCNGGFSCNAQILRFAQHDKCRLVCHKTWSRTTLSGKSGSEIPPTASAKSGSGDCIADDRGRCPQTPGIFRFSPIAWQESETIPAGSGTLRRFSQYPHGYPANRRRSRCLAGRQVPLPNRDALSCYHAIGPKRQMPRGLGTESPREKKPYRSPVNSVPHLDPVIDCSLLSWPHYIRMFLTGNQS